MKRMIVAATSSKNKNMRDKIINIIETNDLVGSAIDIANDRDTMGEYDTPESFANYVEDILFDELVPDILGDYDIELDNRTDLRQLVGKAFLRKIRKRASSGDFSGGVGAYGSGDSLRDDEEYESDVDVSQYANSKFDKDQMDEIRKGLESGVDVSLYADPKFGDGEMFVIRKGLEYGVDVSLYADPKFEASQMNEIMKGLLSGVDVSVYDDPKKYDWFQMFEIRVGLEDGVDVSWYADPKFDYWQMDEIREGLEAGVDVSQYADPKLNRKQMREIREQLEADMLH